MIAFMAAVALIDEYQPAARCVLSGAGGVALTRTRDAVRYLPVGGINVHPQWQAMARQDLLIVDRKMPSPGSKRGNNAGCALFSFARREGQINSGLYLHVPQWLAFWHCAHAGASGIISVSSVSPRYLKLVDQYEDRWVRKHPGNPFSVAPAPAGSRWDGLFPVAARSSLLLNTT